MALRKPSDQGDYPLICRNRTLLHWGNSNAYDGKGVKQYMADQIKSTTEYKMFKTVKGNRPPLPYHIRTLANSIARKNLLSKNPIIVNKDMAVIDGQHRLAAAQELKVPIYYMVEDDASLAEVQMLNSANRAWYLWDFLNSYASVGNQHYITLREFVIDNKLPITVALTILSDEPRDTVKKLFKEGKFAATTTDAAKAFATKLRFFRRYVVATHRNNKSFIDAVKRVTTESEHYDHVRMVEQMQKWSDGGNGKLIQPQATTRDYLRVFEDIYNYNKQNLTRLF